MRMIYDSEIITVGKDAVDILNENMLIIFYENVPDELKDIAAIHKEGEWLGEVKVGDRLILGNESYPISFVGEKVNETLQDLGHCTIKFGHKGPDLPGTLCVDDGVPPKIEQGTVLRFVRS